MDMAVCKGSMLSGNASRHSSRTLAAAEYSPSSTSALPRLLSVVAQSSGRSALGKNLKSRPVGVLCLSEKCLRLRPAAPLALIAQNKAQIVLGLRPVLGQVCFGPHFQGCPEGRHSLC